MLPVLWFIAVLAAAVCYGMRMRVTVGRVAAPLWPWQLALPPVVGIALGALLVSRTGAVIQHDVGVGLNAMALLVCCWFGLRYWVRAPWWDAAAGIAAFAIVGCYLQRPGPLNNPVLALVALGMAVAGYYGTKAWVRTLVAGLAAFDAYAVWGSDTMNGIFMKGSAFPAQFLAMLQVPVPFLQIGTLDIAVAALAIVAVQRHRGVGRSVAFACWCIGAAWINDQLARTGIAWLQAMPYMVCLLPLVLLSLAGPPARRPA